MNRRFLGRLCAALVLGCLLGGCHREFHLVLFNNTNDQIIFRRRADDQRPTVILACTGGDVTGLSTDDLSIERNGRVLHYRFPVGYTYPSGKVPPGYERGVHKLGKAFCIQLASDDKLYLLRTREPFTSYQHPEQPPGFPLVGK